MKKKFRLFFEKYSLLILSTVLSFVSVCAYIHFYRNGLGLAYNDAQSHLDIGRRVVEGLTPGFAQIGSVWLPLNHILMVPTIWNDFMWHSGLAGAIQSMIAYVATGILIFLFLKELNVGMLGRFVGVAVFALNPNVLYLQSTALTESLFMGTMVAGSYYFLLWHKKEKIKFLILAAFWMMLSTLVRYDGWFLIFFAAVLLFFPALKSKKWSNMEGKLLIFCSLGGLGVVLWLLWNLMIFGNPLYFAFGQYSAHVQQEYLQSLGVLHTRGSWLFSARTYLYAMVYNSLTPNFILALFGAISLFFSRKTKASWRYASLLLFAPLIFNILALYLGFSVLYIPGISGDTWFNIRYGILMLPAFGIFIGFLISALSRWRYFQIATILILVMSNFFVAANSETISIHEALFGESGTNVSNASDWLYKNTLNRDGFILISPASLDPVIFSSGLQMKKFIYEGNGEYFNAALKNPEHWARWIVMKSDSDDPTWKALKDNPEFTHYELVEHYVFYDGNSTGKSLNDNSDLIKYDTLEHYSFADIYQLKNVYVGNLITNPITN